MTPHYSDPSVTLLYGDCLDVLREMADSSVDAIVTDPPYGLSNTTSQQVLDCLTHWVQGDREYVPAGLRGFMGALWDGFVPPPAVWNECLRVLKPGGHMLVFTGSRTQDLMGLSIRLAGFEMRDSIAWVHGQGFPKSMDVSKAVTAHETTGSSSRTANRRAMTGNRSRSTSYGSGEQTSTTTATCAAPPRANLTENAVMWRGFGTALKPAQEPIIVARKPLGGATVASNVLRHGTGALNIDGCRVGTTVETWPATRARPLNSKDMHHNYVDGGSVTVSTGQAPAGRWPTNVVLSHTEWCVEVGTRQVRTGTAVNRNRTADNDRATYAAYSMGNARGEDVSYGTDGVETVAAWNCPEGCPVRELDAQSRVSQSGRFRADRGTGGIWATGNGTPCGPQHGDTGGASRYFPTFRYQAKAPTSERPEFVDDDGVSQAHSTVKPLDLMRWLVRLVTPPGGTVLDLFAGSGTTGEACVIEGFKCVLVEREAFYLPLIVARLSKPIQPDLFGGVA